MNGNNIEQGRNAERSSISFVDLLYVIVKRRWLIITTTFAAALLIVGFAYKTATAEPGSPWNILPNYYEPRVKIMITSSQESLASKLGGAGGSMLVNLLGGAQTVNPDLVLANNLLTGKTIQDRIIQEFDLIEKYGLTGSLRAKTEAREALMAGLDLEGMKSLTSKIFWIGYINTDPVFATKILQRYTELLEERFKELTLEKVWRKKRFIEDQLKIAREDLQQAQDELVNFQRHYGVTDISRQASEQAKLIADIRSDIIKKELEIGTIGEYLPEDNPKIVRLKQEIQKKNKLISELKTGLDEFSGEFIPQNMIPALATHYLNLKAELSVQEKIYSTLREEYEMVKIEEADNSRTFQILEPAEVPEKKAGPSRSKICAFITIIAFALSIFLAFAKEYFERVKNDPQESEKLDQIRTMLKNPLKRR